MDILTNGNEFFSPTHESRTLQEEVASYRIDRAPDAAARRRLWGSFHWGDQLSFRLEGQIEAPALKVLDAFFREVPVERAAGHAWVTIPSSGVHYVELPTPVGAALRITRRRAVVIRAGWVSRLVAWAKRRLSPSLVAVDRPRLATASAILSRKVG